MLSVVRILLQHFRRFLNQMTCSIRYPVLQMLGHNEGYRMCPAKEIGSQYRV